MSRENQLAVDLVRDNHDMIPQAYIPYPSQFLTSPYPTCRIMRITEQQELNTWIGGLTLQILIIDMIGLILIFQGIGDDPATVFKRTLRQCHKVS